MSMRSLLCLCVVAAAAISLPVQAQNVTASPAYGDAARDDVTSITVFLKRRENVPSPNLRIDSRSASSCNFIGSDGSADYVADYVRGFTGSYDPYDRNTFGANSPFGDASRDPRFNDFGSGFRGGGLSGCSASDRGFAAGRAAIARRDKTLVQAFELFDQKKYPEALEMFQTSYRKMGYEQAAFYAGKMYLFGLGTEKNTKEAVFWLRKVAEQRKPSRPHVFDPKAPEYMNTQADAIMTLAKIYLTGYDGLPRDPKQALKWFGEATEIGYIPASHIVGDFYYYGVGTAKDTPRAVKNYREAARFGYAPAQVSLAQILEAGEDGVKAEPQQALAWYNEAAKVNHPVALNALAVAYDHGKGVKADPQKALGFYKEAAVRGNPDAQNAIGTYFYQGGALLAKDEAVARKWFEVAARNGQPEAMFNLAAMYARGEGGDRDRVKAAAWFTIAQKAGHDKAEAALRAVEAEMNDAEKAELQKLFAPKN